MVPSENTVQLGIVSLKLHATRQSTDHLPSTWTDLNDGILRYLVYEDDDKALVSAVLSLIQDRGLGFGGEFQVTGWRLIIRCWIMPMEAEGSSWDDDRTGKDRKERTSSLELLFSKLCSSWDDSDAEYLLRTGVSPNLFPLSDVRRELHG